MSTRVRKLWKTSPRYAGMIPKSGDDFFKIISSPRYAGMILNKEEPTMGLVASPRYAGMIPV